MNALPHAFKLNLRHQLHGVLIRWALGSNLPRKQDDWKPTGIAIQFSTDHGELEMWFLVSMAPRDQFNEETSNRFNDKSSLRR
jgi:hypothetical protein